MKRWVRLGGLLLLQLASNIRAMEMSIDQNQENRQVCSGMYSRKSWGGNDDPYILTKFIPPDSFEHPGNPLVSLVVFEWNDSNLIGVPTGNTTNGTIRNPVQRTYICDQAAVDENLCPSNKLGAFILAANESSVRQSRIISEAIPLTKPQPIKYPVVHTGYYCVGTFGFSDEPYRAVVEFRNAFGELPAAQIPKLPFYAAITVIYAFLAIGWGLLYYLHRRDVLPVQNYITAILVFLVLEMFMTWLFYDFQNRHGLNTGAKALMVTVSILSAARNSFSFFLLLIVCMGYGVVKHTLGKTMIYVRWLAITHFVFGVIYAVASLTVTPENAGPLVLLVVLPLAATLTAFYIWTLNSLNATTKDLQQRKQTIKAGMYRKLWYCILLSIAVIFVFFFVNSWIFAGQSAEDFVPNHWKGRWFILDGWLNLVYFFDVAFVAYVWRPTANNRRFAMSDEVSESLQKLTLPLYCLLILMPSQQLAQDEDDDNFEIASLRDSLDNLDADAQDLEGNNNSKTPPPSYSNGSQRRDASPLPAPVPTKPTPLPRESLDGETIFALDDEGEDGKDSEDDGDEEERRGLTGGKKE